MLFNFGDLTGTWDFSVTWLLSRTCPPYSKDCFTRFIYKYQLIFLCLQLSSPLLVTFFFFFLLPYLPTWTENKQIYINLLFYHLLFLQAICYQQTKAVSLDSFFVCLFFCLFVFFVFFGGVRNYSIVFWNF